MDCLAIRRVCEEFSSKNKDFSRQRGFIGHVRKIRHVGVLAFEEIAVSGCEILGLPQRLFKLVGYELLRKEALLKLLAALETGLLGQHFAKNLGSFGGNRNVSKAGYWRQIPVSGELEKILIEQKNETGNEEHVFPRHWEWSRGDQARVLRAFCFLHKLPSIKFHTLRACFATQMLRSGVETARVMKIGGWKDLKTMQHYVRLAGIEIYGATENLKIFAERKNASNPLAQSPGVTVAGHTLDTRFCNPSR